MKGTGFMGPSTMIAPSGTRTVNGIAMISDGVKEVPYPSVASELIKLAMEHGWGVDDGLPARVSEDGTPYVRILIGRNPGRNALDSEKSSPGIQFHIMWRMNSGKRKAWTLSAPMMKTSANGNGWTRVDTITAVRKMICSEPVKLPDTYVQANH